MPIDNNKLLDKLLNISNEYRMFNFSNSSVEDEINEILRMFNNQFEEEDSIICLTPALYIIKDVKNWVLEPFHGFKVYSRIEQEQLKNIVETQDSLNKAFRVPVTKSYLTNHHESNNRIQGSIRLSRYEGEKFVCQTPNNINIVISVPSQIDRDFSEHNLFTLNNPSYANSLINKGGIIDISRLSTESTNLQHSSKSFIDGLIGKIKNDLFQYEDYILAETCEFPLTNCEYDLLAVYSTVTSNSKGEERQKFFGLGGMFVIIRKDLVDNLVIRTLDQIINVLAARVTFQYYRLELKKSQLKSSIAAIMSRNMSHNLGSHVFFYTRQILLELIEKLENGYHNQEYLQLDKGLAWFLHYVQERQDFIANINSQDTYNIGPVNLKQDVFDIINPDSLDERHLTDSNRIITRNLLLENIARSEKVSRILSEQYKEIELLIISREHTLSSKDDSNSPKDLYDIELAVKGGQQSRHAFLIILENIIRNASKHGFNYENQEKLVITIKADIVGDYYCVKIFDNCNDARNEITVEHNKTTPLELLNKNFSELQLIDDNQIIDRSNKGLKEIFVCILWLKDEELSEIESFAKGNKKCKIETYPALEIIAVDNAGQLIEEGNGNICYQFYLPTFKQEIDIQNNDLTKLFGSIYYGVNEKIERPDRVYPLYIENLDSNKDIWKQIFEKEMSKYNSQNLSIRYQIKFDKNQPEVFVTENGFFEENNAKTIFFKNHLAKSEQQLKNEIKDFNNNTIFEHCSGANQTYILLQRFLYYKGNQDLLKSANSLFYRILNAYNSKVVIVDERLSFSQNKNFYYWYNQLVNNKIITKTFSECIFDSYDTSIDEFINAKINSLNLEEFVNTLNEKHKRAIEIKAINIENELSQQDNLDLKFAIKNEFLNGELINNALEKRCKEIFLEQQNTYILDMDEDGRFYDSEGIVWPNRIFTDDLKFFSIHIGLLDKYKYEKRSTHEKLRDLLKKNLEGDCIKLEKIFFSVHSGRGGLNSENEQITFIPFSNLQRCIEDSKYELVEFLNSIKYYPINI
jgi:two-component sensor histidine kinase